MRAERQAAPPRQLPVGALAPTGSPFVLLLDPQGTIVYEGGLESVEWWDTLARRV